MVASRQLRKSPGSEAKGLEEILEKVAREGGQELAEKLARETAEHGVVIMKGAKASPAKFVKAFEELAPEMRSAALQAVGREPELMSGLVARFGKDALEIGAKHPGVGHSLMKTFGREGVDVVQKLSRDEAIQLARMSKQIAGFPSGQRSQLFEMLAKAPGRVLDLLESNPKVLMTAAGLTAFLASKDQILGSKPVILDPDGSVHPAPGLVEKILENFKEPISAVIAVIGTAIASFAGIKLWAAYRISRMRVKIAEMDARVERQKPSGR